MIFYIFTEKKNLWVIRKKNLQKIKDKRFVIKISIKGEHLNLNFGKLYFTPQLSKTTVLPQISRKCLNGV